MNETPTVADLRRKGNKVAITHLRRLKQTPGVLVESYQVKDKNLIDPKGGSTEVTIYTPEGKILTGTANCYWRDAFCRKTGVQHAIKVALNNEN